MAARNITLQFGLVTVPAKSEGAIEKKPDMSNMCLGQPDMPEHPATPVTAPKTCAHCGPIRDYTALKKGIKSGGSYTLVDQSEIAEAKAEFTAGYKGVLNLVPHPAADFLAATAPGESLNYLTPADASAAGHYKLLVRMVESHPELAFVGLHTPVSATNLFMLGVRDGVLVMEQRTRSQALKPAPSVGGDLNEGLYAMLEGALQAFITPYDADAYEDGYTKALQKMAAEGEQVTTDKAEGKSPIIVTDDALMEKLRALQAVS